MEPRLVALALLPIAVFLEAVVSTIAYEQACAF